MLTPFTAKSQDAQRGIVTPAKASVTLCYKKVEQAVAFVEFCPDVHTRSGFSMSQFLQYKLDSNPSKSGGESASPEQLELGFSTADVVIRGARLAPLVELLVANQLASLEAVATDAKARYANLHPSEPWVASITVNRFDKPAAAGG
jgi:hypothetical protein